MPHGRAPDKVRGDAEFRHDAASGDLAELFNESALLLLADRLGCRHLQPRYSGLIIQPLPKRPDHLTEKRHSAVIGHNVEKVAYDTGHFKAFA